MPAIPRLSDASHQLQHRAAQGLRALLSRTTAHAARSEAAHEATKRLSRREIVPGIIPTYYQNQDGMAAATVVGITLGSVAAFLFICWLLVTVCGLAGGPAAAGTVAGDEEIVVRKRAKTSSSSKKSRRSRHTEVRERSRSPRRSSNIILEERRSGGPRRSSVIVEERYESRVPGDDIVEVIEENSSIEPPRRKRSHRNNGYRY